VNVLFLFFANLALFALMAFKLFGGEKLKRPSGEADSNVGYFDSFVDSYWQLYVLVSTANSPDVMIPAYERSK
jgi:two pore calcium channel protein 3